MPTVCPNCLDQGWVWYIPNHKTYPTDCAPCQECNKDEHIQHPNSNSTYEIVVGSGTGSLWQEGTSCPYCTDAVLVKTEPNGMKCPSCGYAITWTN